MATNLVQFLPRPSELISEARSLARRFPSSSEGSKNYDRSSSRVCAICVEFVLCRQKFAIGIQHIGKRNRAGAVGLFRQVTNFNESLYLSLEFGAVRFGLNQQRQSILDVFC